MPVYKLLGGPVRDRIRFYRGCGGATPEEAAARARGLVAKGYTAIKTGTNMPLRPPRIVESPAFVDKVVDRFAAMREAVGSEIECHPHWGNPDLKVYKASKMAFARFARRYSRDPALTYRHIVPSAFTSPMGPGLISGATAARIALFWIGLGCRYVPVTYTGIAFLNWFRMRFGERASDADVLAMVG